MSKSLLLVCPTCERHVRVVDTSCPFCGLELSETTRAALALRPLGKRLTRAAFYALSMGTMTLAAACSSSTVGGEGSDGGGGTDAVGTDSNEEACVCPPYGQPAYGAPADARAVDVGGGDGGTSDAADAGEHEGGILPPYGHPPFDASDE
jgi:hypothetical protein